MDPAEGPPDPDAGESSRDAAARAEEERSTWRTVAQWSSVGFEFAAGIVLFFLLGGWLDARWGTHPWMRVAGASLGIVLGMYLVIKKALASERPDRGTR